MADQELEDRLALLTDEERKAYKQNKEREKTKQQNIRNELKGLLARANGRLLLWKLFDITRLYKISFTGNSTTFFNEGSRNVGIALLNMVLEADPEGYVKLLQEYPLQDKELKDGN